MYEWYEWMVFLWSQKKNRTIDSAIKFIIASNAKILSYICTAYAAALQSHNLWLNHKNCNLYSLLLVCACNSGILCNCGIFVWSIWNFNRYWLRSSCNEKKLFRILYAQCTYASWETALVKHISICSMHIDTIYFHVTAKQQESYAISMGYVRARMVMKTTTYRRRLIDRWKKYIQRSREWFVLLVLLIVIYCSKVCVCVRVRLCVVQLCSKVDFVYVTYAERLHNPPQLAVVKWWRWNVLHSNSAPYTLRQ